MARVHPPRELQPALACDARTLPAVPTRPLRRRQRTDARPGPDDARPWDGTAAGLPGGVDDAVEQGAALADGEADTLCAIVAVLDPAARGRRLSSLVIDAMRPAAATA